jgi:hypothetical protein
MSRIDTQLVDLVREFTRAHDAIRAVGQQLRSGSLEFETVEALVGSGEESVLYRLKERCHRLFRTADDSQTAIGGGPLFDLAVGSLFHEAMKLRENFYQQWAYGPRLRALRETDVSGGRGLVAEFEKILADTEGRLNQSLQETEVLLEQTTEPLRALLRDNRASGPLARYLADHHDEVAHLFGGTGTDVLVGVYGSASAAFEVAARSYLESGFFTEGRDALAASRAAGAKAGSMVALEAYAEGMCAYLAGDYGACFEQLCRWIEAPPSAREAGPGSFAVAGLSKVGQLVDDPDLARRAGALAEQIRSYFADPSAEGGAEASRA